MIGHKISCYGEIWLIIPKLSLLHLLIWSTVAIFSSQNRINFTSTFMNKITAEILDSKSLPHNG